MPLCLDKTLRGGARTTILFKTDTHIYLKSGFINFANCATTGWREAPASHKVALLLPAPLPPGKEPPANPSCRGAGYLPARQWEPGPEKRKSQ